MRRVLLTGMSGTGKSSLIREFAALGYRAIDTDEDGWCVPPDGSDARGAVQPDWVWDEDRMHALLGDDDGEGVLFVAGCVENQGSFSSLFDEIVLLSAPAEVITERLATRTGNPFGKRPGELAKVLEDRRVFEPRLRRAATMVVDTSLPIDVTVAAILDRVR